MNTVLQGQYSYVDNYDGREWTQDPIEGGNEYYLDSLKTPVIDDTRDTWAEIPYTGSGDYCGSGDIGESNYRVIKEDFYDKDHPDIALVYGSYGYKAVLYRVNTTDTEILDVLKRLRGYPLLDEDINSEVRMEWENEAWESWARSDFKRALIKKFTVVPADLQSWTAIIESKAWQTLIDKIEDAIDDMEDDKVFEIFRVACDESNTYWESELSGSHIDIDRVVKAVEWSDLEITDLEDKNNV